MNKNSLSETALEKARRLREEGQARAHSKERRAVEARLAKQAAATVFPKPVDPAASAMNELRFSSRERTKIATFAAANGLTEVQAVRELALKALANK